MGKTSKDEFSLVNLLFAETLKQAITGTPSEKIVAELMLKLRSVIKEDEFKFVKSKIEEILKKNIELPPQCE